MGGEDFGEIIGAVNSGWGVVALLIIGFYTLLWKFGRDLITGLQVNSSLVRESRDVGIQISRDIKTNHGSENLGNAVDRLTEWILQHMEDARSSDIKLLTLQREFLNHAVEGKIMDEKIVGRIAELDDALQEVHRKLEGRL